MLMTRHAVLCLCRCCHVRRGISSSDINRSILLRCPQVLLLEQQQLHALYSFLQHTCALPDTRIRDFVVAAPLVLLQDVQRQLQPRIAFLQQVRRLQIHSSRVHSSRCFPEHGSLQP
jgi:hypothetical protein